MTRHLELYLIQVQTICDEPVFREGKSSIKC